MEGNRDLTFEDILYGLGSGPVTKFGLALANGVLDWAKYPGQVYQGTAPENIPQTDWGASTALLMAGAPRPPVKGPVLYSGAGAAMPKAKLPEGPNFAKQLNDEELLKTISDALGQMPVKTVTKPQVYKTQAGQFANEKAYAKAADEAFAISPEYYAGFIKQYPPYNWGKEPLTKAVSKYDAYNPPPVYEASAKAKADSLNPFEQAAATGDISPVMKAQETATASKALDPVSELDHYRRAREANKNIPEAPIEEHTRQARRIVAGFDTPAYHGSRDWNGRKLSTNEKGQANFYTSAQPELADMYAGVYPGNSPQNWNVKGYDKSSVQPLYLNTKDFHVHDAKGQSWSSATANEKGIKDAQAKGAPGVTIRNVYDEPASTQYLGAPKDIHIVFDPTKVRSAFAQFDPKKLDLNDLLAGLGGGGVVAGAVSDPNFLAKLMKGEAL